MDGNCVEGAKVRKNGDSAYLCERLKPPSALFTLEIIMQKNRISSHPFKDEFILKKVENRDSLKSSIDIINYSEINSVLRLRKNIRVLDIGCRVPVFLWCCYHMFDCKSLIGIDKSTRDQADTELLIHLQSDDYENYKKLRDKSSSYEWYLQLIRPDEEEKPVIGERNFFNDRFDIRYSTPMQAFLPSAKWKFDLINAGNVLHFIEDHNELEEMLKHIKRLLKPEGYVLMRIQNAHGREYFDYSRFKTILKKQFTAGLLLEYYENDIWEMATFKNFVVNEEDI